MSKRMRQLAEQAGYYIDPDFDIEFEEFAELIIKECMDLALAEQMRYSNISHRDMSESAVTLSNFRLLMKDHFGVEL